MRPVVWSSSYLFRWPFGISIVTSNCTGRSVADRTPEDPRRSVSGGGHHRVQRVGDRHAEVLPAPSPPPAGGPRLLFRAPPGGVRRAHGGRRGRGRVPRRGAGRPGAGGPVVEGTRPGRH